LKTQTWNKASYTLSNDRNQLQIDRVYDFLRQTYWAEDISREQLITAIHHSECFGLYHKTQQIGFARVITDFATFGYLADLFILPAYRRQGLAAWLVKTILEQPELQLKNWMLATRDAHGLYTPAGFTPLAHPEFYMQKYQSDN
jgi:GNAT superfamily N-acetyltransferase